jgi:hypothetical protein
MPLNSLPNKSTLSFLPSTSGNYAFAEYHPFFFNIFIVFFSVSFLPVTEFD